MHDVCKDEEGSEDGASQLLAAVCETYRLLGCDEGNTHMGKWRSVLMHLGLAMCAAYVTRATDAHRREFEEHSRGREGRHPRGHHVLV